jgi:hypothetical protein
VNAAVVAVYYAEQGVGGVVERGWGERERWLSESDENVRCAGRGNERPPLVIVIRYGTADA